VDTATVDFQWNQSAVQDAVHQRLIVEMHRIGNDVVTRAQGFAPKRTGQLATSIHYDWNDANYQLVFVVDAPYGMFVEFGTRFMSPHPYMRPALDAVGEIYGFETELAFANLPHINRPVILTPQGFHMPPELTARQRAHVKYRLEPSFHHWNRVGKNVKRTRIGIRSYHG
jgi:HK97 gp10 family phage protein